MQKRVGNEIGGRGIRARREQGSGCEVRKSGDGAAFVCRRGRRASGETARTRVPSGAKGPGKGPELPPALPVWRVNALLDMERHGLARANDCAWVARDKAGTAHGVRTVNSLVADGLARFVRQGRGVEITAAGRAALAGQERRDRATLGEVLGVLIVAGLFIGAAIWAPGVLS